MLARSVLPLARRHFANCIMPSSPFRQTNSSICVFLSSSGVNLLHSWFSWSLVNIPSSSLIARTTLSRLICLLIIGKRVVMVMRVSELRRLSVILMMPAIEREREVWTGIQDRLSTHSCECGRNRLFSKAGAVHTVARTIVSL